MNINNQKGLLVQSCPRPILVLAALLGLAVALPARADRRTLIRAYEVATQPQGNLELELWNELDIPRGRAADIGFTQRIELEYGLTDRWDVALYHVFAGRGTAESYGFDSWRVESRYQLFDKGEFPVDLMLYLEVERPADFTAPWILEGKLIGQKDLGRLALVANLVFERGLSEAGEMNAEVDLGARYELHPALRVGAELWTRVAWTHGGDTGAQAASVANYLGPSLSVATGKFWLQAGAGWGLGAEHSVFARSVIGINL